MKLGSVKITVHIPETTCVIETELFEDDYGCVEDATAIDCEKEAALIVVKNDHMYEVFDAIKKIKVVEVE